MVKWSKFTEGPTSLLLPTSYKAAEVNIVYYLRWGLEYRSLAPDQWRLGTYIPPIQWVEGQGQRANENRMTRIKKRSSAKKTGRCGSIG